MGHTIIFLTLAALFYQAQSQLCVTPGLAPQVIANPPLVTAPQVISSPIIGTTIVDNSVSTALANALQLLIVSNIIDTKLSASCVNNLLNPVLETPCYPRVDIECIAPCAAPVEIISPCRSFAEPMLPYGIAEPLYAKPYGVIEPYPYLGCSEILTPNLYDTFGPCGTEIGNPWLPNAYLPDVVAPRNCYGVNEIISPNFYPFNSCGVEVIAPNPFAPVCGNDVVAITSYNPGCYGGFNEIITPISYSSCGEIIPYSLCGITEVISPCGPYYGGLPEVVTPITPCNTGCFSNVAEFITPYNSFGISEVINPISPFNPGCGVAEVVAPCSPCYGGVPEVISPVYRPGCVGIPEFLPMNPFGPCRVPEIVTPCGNTFPEVIVPTSFNPGCSGCEFCGPAFSPNFGYLPTGPC